MRLNKPSLLTQRWFMSCSIGLGIVLSVVIVVILHTQNRTTHSPAGSELVNQQGGVLPSSLSNTALSMSDTTPPQLPYLDFPSGSVEEACGLNGFPPYHYREEDGSRGVNSPFNSEWDWIPLTSEECWTALEKHANNIDPYHFLWGDVRYNSRPIAFVVLDNPLTFERIFSDPAGDFALVQDALSRSECLLTGDETNWELKETCNAEAFLNYALVHRFCFGEGVRHRERMYHWEEEHPTPEQDRFMWKQELEGAWVRKKCEDISSDLKLTGEQHLELTKLISSWDAEENEGLFTSLIELAARLGDDAAGLTQSFVEPFSFYYGEQGYKYGRFSWLLTSEEWENFVVKKAPSADRFLQTFKMLTIVAARRPDPRDEIEFDWEWVVQHLCTSPYSDIDSYHGQIEAWRSELDEAELALLEKSIQPKNCREVVHELRQRDLKFPPLLKTLDKFEQVALELGVYE